MSEYRIIKGERHYVFEDAKEFKEFFHSKMMSSPEVKKNWREGKQGDWVFSDDNRIVQLLKVGTLNHPNDRKNYKWAKNYVRTVVGTFVNNEKTFMDTDFEQHPNRYTFSKTIKHTNGQVKKRKKLTNNEKLFTTNVVSGMGPVKAYMDAFKATSEDKARKKALILLKQERVMTDIEKGVLDVAKELGIDHKYILDRLKCLADNSEDDNIILQSTKELGKIIGTSVNSVKQRDVGVIGMFQGFSPEQIESVKPKKIANANIED